MSTNGEKTIGVRSDKLHEKVAAIVAEANDYDVTMSSFVRAAINEKIARHEQINAKRKEGKTPKTARDVVAEAEAERSVGKLASKRVRASTRGNG